MTKIFRHTSLAITLLLVGCITNPVYQRNQYSSPYQSLLNEANNATSPTTEETRSLNYGHPPKNYESLFKKAVKESLKDPGSAQFRKIQKPKKFWGKSLDIRHSWLLCGEVNAKNSFGGFTGFETFAVQYFADGSIDMLPLEDGRTNFTFASEVYPCSN